ncbi:homeobox protein cut-like 1 [Artibeus jamaicensis]|uniref:homeobox protein cut-like 1 n=1 Tax=Artibeus jamaicensis TaxID=9417 RepID=UPI00235B0D6D|nr:homeobox protein cut-like 1 [Artibeus jamaicensis]
MAGGAARALPASPAPAPASPPGGGASAAAGTTRRAGARAEPSPSRRRRRAPRVGSLPARRLGCRGAAGWRDGGGRGARTGIGAEDRTLRREGSVAPELKSTWRKEEEWTPGSPPRRAPVHLFTVCPLVGHCTTLLLSGKRRLS